MPSGHVLRLPFPRTFLTLPHIREVLVNTELANQLRVSWIRVMWVHAIRRRSLSTRNQMGLPGILVCRGATMQLILCMRLSDSWTRRVAIAAFAVAARVDSHAVTIRRSASYL